MKQFKFGDRVRSTAMKDVGTYIYWDGHYHRVYMDSGYIRLIGDYNIRPESEPIPGQVRRQSRVEQAHAARTAEDHATANSIIAAVRGLDSPRTDFRRVAEIVCEFITPDYTEEQERYADRLTDHLANVVAAMACVIESRQAARMDTLPAACGVVECKCKLSGPEGNGFDDIDTSPVRRTYADYEWASSNGGSWYGLTTEILGICPESPEEMAMRRLNYTTEAGKPHFDFRRVGTHEPVTSAEIIAEVEGVVPNGGA